MLAPDPEDRTNLTPLPDCTSFEAKHAPQADAAKHHGVSILRGLIPHKHLILEDLPFAERQRLGNHMDLFHAP